VKTINAILMIDISSPTGHYYLEYLRSAGFLPKKILILRKGLKYDLKSFRQNMKRNLVKKNREIDRKVTEIVDGINAQFPINIKRNYKYSDYCSDVVYLHSTIDGPNSKNVIEDIQKSDVEFVIFSGGGILKKEILSIPDKQFIHVHPGIVPNIRGADCFFWSVLERDKPGYTCFYMTPEIDEGDILLTKEYELSNLSFLKSMPQELNYKAILNSLDLHFRADCLVSCIKKYDGMTGNLKNIKTIKQNPNDGRMYFFMHPKLIEHTLEKIFSLSQTKS
jgi:hypothetical protein